MKHDPVQVGFAGIASEWLEELPTLKRQPRLRVSAVYDATPALAALGADKLQATHLKGFLQLVDSPLVDAVVIGNAGWLGWTAALQCLKRGLPTLLVLSRLDDTAFFDPQLPDLIRLEEALAYARADNGFLMPGLPLRWLPTTIRVRELTATSLGAIEQLTVTTRRIAIKSRQLAEVIDWGLSVVQSIPESVEVHKHEDQLRLVVLCRRRQKSGEPVTIQIHGLTQQAGEVPERDFRAVAQCRHGEFQLETPATITHAVGRMPVEEHLTADRSAYDVMLDLFGRRLVGGVVPVPDFNEVLRARNLIMSAVRSMEGQERVRVVEDGTGV